MNLSQEPCPLVIGVGNTFRCDDALGIFTARELSRRHPGCLRVTEISGDGTRLAEAWRGEPSVIVIDAVAPGRFPGRIYRIDALRESVPPGLFLSSSHQFGIAEAVALSKRLDDLPGSLILAGIEGSNFDSGVGLSDSVVKHLPELLRLIEEELDLVQPS